MYFNDWWCYMFFDDFNEVQHMGYFLLKNSLLKGNLSHAYLIDANNYEFAYDFVFSFIKMILCPHHYSKSTIDKCDSCNICHRIDDFNYSDIRIIESNSFVIKKEQLLDLQSDFSTFSIEGNYRVYVIKDCEKMNKQASNCILKFLEEPNESVIAILVTNSIGKVLDTIVSRCQVVRLCNPVALSNRSSLENFAFFYCNSRDDVVNFLECDLNKTIMNSVLEFILYFEENGLDVLIFIKKMWYNSIKTKEDNLLAFTMLIYFYYDILNYKIGNNNCLFCEHIDILKKIADSNSVDFIVKKLDIIYYGYDMIFCNLNINLLLDDIIIRLGEVK